MICGSIALYMPEVSQVVIVNEKGPMMSPETVYFPYETSL